MEGAHANPSPMHRFSYSRPVSHVTVVRSDGIWLTGAPANTDRETPPQGIAKNRVRKSPEITFG